MLISWIMLILPLVGIILGIVNLILISLSEYDR